MSFIDIFVKHLTRNRLALNVGCREGAAQSLKEGEIRVNKGPILFLRKEIEREQGVCYTSKESIITWLVVNMGSALRAPFVGGRGVSC